MIWLALAFLLLCSGTLSASETALFGLSRQTVHQWASEPSSARRRVFTLMQTPRRVLTTVLIANTAVNVAIFSTSFLTLRQQGTRSAMVEALGGALVLLAVILFGELLPKSLAYANAEKFAPPAAALNTLLQTVLGPIRWTLGTFLVEPITRLLAPPTSPPDAVGTDELHLLVEQSTHEGIITSAEQEMLQAVVALRDVSVREVMIPRVDMRSLSVECQRGEAEKLLREWSCRRVPVRGRDLDDIRGVLYTRDVHLNLEASIPTLIRSVGFVPEQINLLQLLRHFRAERVQMLIVVDEFGGTSGLVTIEDVIEWVVGELPDVERADDDVLVEQLDENTYRLSGQLSARVWADRFGGGEIVRHADTVAGVVLGKLGRSPRVGDTVHLRNLTLTVEEVSGRRIDRVLLRRDDQSGSSEARP